jgi:drug/metabolite transporter (DMT)-like permease
MVLGCIYLGCVLLVIGYQPVDLRSIIYLAVSGLVGIGIGDTFFFFSLVLLGPRLASLMGTLNPVLIALRRPAAVVGLGIFLTVIGVFWVLRERTPAGTDAPRKSLGIICGLLSVLCTTVGVTTAKVGLESVPAMEATVIRLLWGAVGLVLWGLVRGQIGEWVMPLRDRRVLGQVAAVVLLVVFGGFWLSLYALKHVDASIAGPLNSTAPLFILPLVVVLQKERISRRAVLGASVAVSGVATIIIGSH